MRTHSYVRDKRSQPPILLRYRNLSVYTLGVEGGYDPRRSDLAQCLVYRRHGVRIADRKTVQVSIVTGDAHSAGLLGDAYDGLTIGLTGGRMRPMSSSSRICRLTSDRDVRGTRYGFICLGTNSGVVTM